LLGGRATRPLSFFDSAANLKFAYIKIVQRFGPAIYRKPAHQITAGLIAASI